MIQPWIPKNKRLDYDCGFFKVHIHQSASPTTGKEHSFYVLSTPDWVNVVAVTPEKKLVMVTQYRHGSGEISLEIPGGAVDQGEEPLQAARRELREETGYETSQWIQLGQLRPNPAILSNTCFIFLAQDARPATGLKLDEAEELEASLHDLTDVFDKIRRGQIRHSLVVAALNLFNLSQGEPLP